MDKQILLADEVANILRVDVQRIYQLVRTNQIPVIKIGARQYRFSSRAIEQFLHSGGNVIETEVEDNE